MLGKPSPTGVVTGPFSPTRVRSIDSISSLGMYSLILLKGLGAGLKDFPLELHTGGFQNAHGRLCDFRADAVARNKCDLVGHILECVGRAPSPAAFDLPLLPCLQPGGRGRPPHTTPAHVLTTPLPRTSGTSLVFSKSFNSAMNS